MPPGCSDHRERFLKNAAIPSMAPCGFDDATRSASLIPPSSARLPRARKKPDFERRVRHCALTQHCEGFAAAANAHLCTRSLTHHMQYRGYDIAPGQG